MEPGDGVVEVDFLERFLPTPFRCVRMEENEEAETILYNASFAEMEDNYIKYQTTRWVLTSLLLVLAWGIGFLMLIYIPILRYVLRKDFRSRRLYVTPNAIVYKIIKPAPFPFLGAFKKEKHVLLPSVADIIIEQGHLESYFGIYSIRIENVGVSRPPSDDLHIQGIANPRTFRKVVLTRLHSMRDKRFNGQFSAKEDMLGPSSVCPCASIPSSSSCKNDYLPHEELILQKLEEVGSYVKKVQTLVEKKPSRDHDGLKLKDPHYQHLPSQGVTFQQRKRRITDISNVGETEEEINHNGNEHTSST